MLFTTQLSSNTAASNVLLLQTFAFESIAGLLAYPLGPTLLSPDHVTQNYGARVIQKYFYGREPSGTNRYRYVSLRVPMPNI